MGRAGDGVLGDARPDREEARDAVHAGEVAGGGDDDAPAVDGGQAGLVGVEPPDVGGVGGDHHQVGASGQHRLHPVPAEPDGLEQAVGGGPWLRGIGREVHGHPAVGVDRAGEDAAPGVEASTAQHRGGGQGGVAAEVDLHGRGEPAEVVVAVGSPHREGGLRQVHLVGHLLHPPLGGRAVEEADGRRVAGERAVGEGVDDDQVGGHSGLLGSAAGQDGPDGLVAVAGPGRG